MDVYFLWDSVLSPRTSPTITHMPRFFNVLIKSVSKDRGYLLLIPDDAEAQK